MKKQGIEVKPRGLDVPELDINKLNKMERITSMGKVDAKETKELLVALAKVAVSTKESIDDDGEFTGGDMLNYVDDVSAIIKGVVGAGKIPAEFADGYDDVEKADITNAVSEVLQGIAPNDSAAVDAGLDVIYAINKFLIVAGVIKQNG